MVLAVCLPSIAVDRTIKPSIPAADRHQPGKVFLEHADELNLDQNESGGEYQVLRGNVVFRKGDMFMYCDSAYFYDKTNSLDAFSHVRMEQGDTLFVYGDELNYDGPNEFATLYGLPGIPVKMINRDVKLETDIFYYDLELNYGFYDVGGVLTDKQNRLESMRGEYFPDTKDADFYDDVELRSLREGNDTLLMYTDVLHYNTSTYIATITAPTRIINKDGRILTTSGVYNTNTGVGDLYQRSTVFSNRGNTLTGDTLFYDRDAGFGEGFGNVVLTDSARESSLFGDYGFYDQLKDSAFVTGHALAKEYRGGKDTLYLHGDTINAFMVMPDSIKYTNAFRGVRFYRSDMQGLCDSLSSCSADSMVRMYYSPVVWSGDKQIFGNLIEVHMNDSTADKAYLPDFGFMAEHIAEDCFNQLSGNKMTAWFNDSVITRLYVEGNVMAIMFPMENDSTYNKYSQTESSFMDAYFNDGQIDTVKMWPETTGRVVPLYLAKRGSYFLPKFKWLETLRPTSPESVLELTLDPEGLLKPIDTGIPRTAAPTPALKAVRPRAEEETEADTTSDNPLTEEESSTESVPPSAEEASSDESAGNPAAEEPGENVAFEEPDSTGGEDD